MKIIRSAVAVVSIIVIAYAIAGRRERPPIRATEDDGVLQVVVLGDSVARGTGDERGLGIAGHLDARLHALGVHAARVRNLGINGARTANVLRLLHQANAVRAADAVVVSIGGNDLYGDAVARLLSGIAPAVHQHAVANRVAEIVTTVHALNPLARVYLLGLYNPYPHAPQAAWLDTEVNLWDARLIEKFAADSAVDVVRIGDLMAHGRRISALDHFHPGSAAYAAITDRIVASLVN